MTWVKLDDQFADHPKVVAAGPLASWLYVCGLTYAARLRTDGFIPEGQVRRLALVEEPEVLARKLVEVGLWEIVDGGFQIHDYADYQLTRDDIERRRAAGKAGGQASAKARAQAPAEAPAEPRARKVLDRSHTDTQEDTQEEGEEIAPAAPTRARRRNPLWDALVEACGAPQTASEESDFGRTVRELKQARAGPEEIAAFAAWWVDEMPAGTMLTHRCFRRHWSAFKNGLQRANGTAAKQRPDPIAEAERLIIAGREPDRSGRDASGIHDGSARDGPNRDQALGADVPRLPGDRARRDG